MLDLPTILIEAGGVVDMKLGGNGEFFHINNFHKHVQNDKVVLVDVLSEGLEQETGLLFEFSIGAQDQEDVKADLLVKNRREVIALAHKHLRKHLHRILVRVLVVKLAKARHLLFNLFFLNYFLQLPASICSTAAPRQ
jgi:hypothetical protein